MDLPARHNGIFYSDFLKELVALREAERYLEIGVQAGLNLSKIAVSEAIGVDPGFCIQHDITSGKKSCLLYRCSSDQFFKREFSFEKIGGRLDFSFLDGMHLFEFLLRDIRYAEMVSATDAVLALHDCLPLDGEMIERINNFDGRSEGPYRAAWTGDVWKTIEILEKYRPDINIVLVDCAPTGIVLLTNLDPANKTLETRYAEIVEEFRARPNDKNALESFYDKRSLVEAAHLLANQSLYLKS